MSKIDLQKYFDDALTFTFKDQEFKVDETNKAYQLCQTEMKKEMDKEDASDEKIYKIIFKHAFGEKYEEFQKIELPAKAYLDLSFEIMSAWTGLDKKEIKSQMKIPSSK